VARRVEIPGPDRPQVGEAVPGMRYDAAFLDVDGTLLWVDLDVEGYVEDLAPYVTNGSLSAETAARPVWEGLRRYIKENIEHRTRENLALFKRRNADITAEQLGIRAPTELLEDVAERRISFNPHPESEAVLRRLFEEALETSDVGRERALHVGNDPVADVKGAAEAGIDAVPVDRRANVEAPEATFVVRDIGELPDLLRG
jgi:putative hydrolase of the HAD superfamily